MAKLATKAKVSDRDKILKECAAEINTLTTQFQSYAKRMKESCIALGKILTRARDQFQQHGKHRPGWNEWIVANTEWSVTHVNELIRIAGTITAFRDVLPAETTFAVLRVICHDSITEDARAEIIDLAQKRAERGESVTRNEARQIARKHKQQHDDIDIDDLEEFTDQERWENSISHFAGELVSLPAYWDKEFGKQWRKFKAPSELVTLVTQAAEVWIKLASDLNGGKK